MNNAVKNFPSDPYEAIAMIYVEKAIANGCTPEEAIKIYWETHSAVGKVKV